MSDPIIDPSDLQTYLGVGCIDEGKAAVLIADAQALCEAEVTPLPATAALVVRRVAARAYTNINSVRSTTMGQTQVTYGAPAGSASTGGLYLTATDRKDLRRLNGGGGAFSVDLTPDDALSCLPPWDYQFLPQTSA